MEFSSRVMQEDLRKNGDCLFYPRHSLCRSRRKGVQDISEGHPYPLLNALKLEARNTANLDLKSVHEQLKKAEVLRLAQTRTMPVTDRPWCYFDLAEIRLYQNDESGFLGFVNNGIESCDASWQPKSFRDSLRSTLVDKGIHFDGLAEGLKLLEDAIAAYDKS